MISKETLQMFKELTDAPGAVGFESKPREVMSKWIEPYADSLKTDNLGSLIATKKGNENGPRIMIASHLDEVGYMISQITDDGFLRFVPLGGWWEQVMLAQRVSVVTRTGIIEGVVGSKPPHLLTSADQKKPVEKKDMFIDIGASSKDEAIEFGVRPGDFVVPVCPFTVMKNPKLLMAKAWDNRIGCAIVIEVLKRLQNEKHDNIIFGVGTVQEEVGLRGAQTAAQMIKPDIAIAIDVGVAGDTPGIAPNEATSRIGKGPQLFLMDKTMIAHHSLRDLVMDVADQVQIPYQTEAAAYGGTDAGSIHTILNGVPSLALTIPTRYIHSSAAIIHYDDFEYTVNLFVEVIKRLDREMVDKIKGFTY